MFNQNNSQNYEERLTVRLSGEYVEAIEQLANEEGVSSSTIIRRAVQAFLTGIHEKPRHMDSLDEKAEVASVIRDLNYKTNKALTRVLAWRSADVARNNALWERALNVISAEYPKTYEWLEKALAKL